MVKIKFFVKNECSKCDYVKERLPSDLKMEFFNVDSVAGMAEGAFYEILDKTFPVLVIDGKFVAEGSVNTLKKIEEIVGTK